MTTTTESDREFRGTAIEGVVNLVGIMTILTAIAIGFGCGAVWIWHRLYLVEKVLEILK